MNLLVARAYGVIDLHYKSLYGNGLAVRYSGALVPEPDFEQYRNVDYAAIAAWSRNALEKQGRMLSPVFP